MSQYSSEDYETKGRFASYWHQIDEVRKHQNPESGTVLLVGKGSGIVEVILKNLSYVVKTLDIDADLHPDYNVSILATMLPDDDFSCVVCCEVLEHIEYQYFSSALKEITRILKSGGRLILSLPDLQRLYRYSIQIPLMGEFRFLVPIPLPNFLKKKWVFNGEHYWNISNRDYPIRKIRNTISEISGLIIKNEYRVFEMSWHRFFICEK